MGINKLIIKMSIYNNKQIMKILCNNNNKINNNKLNMNNNKLNRKLINLEIIFYNQMLKIIKMKLICQTNRNK